MIRPENNKSFGAYKLLKLDRQLLAELNAILSAEQVERIAKDWRECELVAGCCHRCAKPRPTAYAYGAEVCAACYHALRGGAR